MKNIIVLVSGGGTNLQALIDAEKSGAIQGGKITCVISSNPNAYALERAKNNGIAARIILTKTVLRTFCLIGRSSKRRSNLI